MPYAASDELPDPTAAFQYRYDLLVAQTPVNTGVSCAVSAIIAYAVRDTVPGLMLLLWVGGIWAIALLAFTGYLRHATRQPGRIWTPSPKTRQMITVKATLFAAISGVLWGITALMLPAAAQTQQLILCLCALGLACGGATTLSAFRPAAIAYVAMILLPYTAYFALTGQASGLTVTLLGLIVTGGLVASTNVVSNLASDLARTNAELARLRALSGPGAAGLHPPA